MRKYENSSADEENRKLKLLIIDDEIGILDALSSFFIRKGFDVQSTTNPLVAIEKVKQESFDILILDYLMTPIHGNQVVEAIRQFNDTLYILLLTGHRDIAPPAETLQKLDIQGYCEKGDKFDQLYLMVLSGSKYVKQLSQIKETENKLEKSYLNLIELLRGIVDMKDFYTHNHSERVSFLSSELGKKLKLNSEDIETLRIAGLFHDVGKIAIPDKILNKPDKLTKEEYEVIKQHPTTGSKLIQNVDFFKNIVPCIKYHHEKYDGTGYPDGLKKEDIPYLARIVQVADSFDAMLSNRIYSEPMDLESVLKEMERCSGSQFDPDISTVFIDMIRKNDNDLLKSINAIIQKK